MNTIIFQGTLIDHHYHRLLNRLLILFELGEVKAGGTGQIVYNVFLKGPARIICAGELRSEALL